MKKRLLSASIILLALGIVALGSVATASAAPVAPMLTPATVVSENFDGSGPFNYTAAALDMSPFTSAAWWGRTSRVKKSGTFSLWVAGTRPTGWYNPPAWPANYPKDTGGVATVTASALKDYYSSTLQFSYTMPTLPAADLTNGFIVLWEDPANPIPTLTSHYGPSWFHTTAENGWRTMSLRLVAQPSQHNMSRTSTSFQFQFMNDGTATGSSTGEGPSIDDVQVTGWYYGPVRNLGATPSGGNVALSWSKPAGTYGSSGDDSRTLKYYVWRTPDRSPYLWTLVTPTAVSGLTANDTAVPAGRYRYVVQAWDSATASTRYGQVVLPNDSVAVTVGSPAKTTQRVAGLTRMQTAIEASKKGFPNGLAGSKTAVVTNGWDWQTSLPGSALAGAVGGPLLLADGGQDLPLDVQNELIRLGAENVYVIGNTTQVPVHERNQISQLGIGVTPIDGGSPSATARVIAQTMKSLRGGTNGGFAFLTKDSNFPDALSASSIAAAEKAPILLTSTATLSNAARDALNDLKPTTIVICGDEKSVSAAIRTELDNLSWNPTIVPKAGLGRYDTSKELALYGMSLLNTSPTYVHVANGDKFPDALGGGVMASRYGGKWNPLVITTPLVLSSQVSSLVSETPTMHDAAIFGDTKSVAAPVETSLKTYLH